MQKRTSTDMRSSAKAPALPAERIPSGNVQAKGLRGNRVIDALYVEHRYAARLLDLLEEQRATLLRGQPIDREAALGAMTYLTQHSDAYHHPREDAMFARLAKRDPRLATRIAGIERAHRTIGSAGRDLLAALRGLHEDGRADEAGVASRMGDYIGALREHMAIEERELFARAGRLLNDEDLLEIDRAFRRVTDPLFEASVRDAYATYPPLVRHLAEKPALRQALGLLDAVYESVLTLGGILFGGVPEGVASTGKQPRGKGARKASH